MSLRSLLPLALVLPLSGCLFGGHFDLDLGDFDFVADFYDPMAYPDDGAGRRSLGHAIPMGARLDAVLDDYDASWDGGLIAETADSDVITVEHDGGETISLRAVSEGEVEVRLAATDSDEVETKILRVEPIAHSEVLAFQQGLFGTEPVAPSQVEVQGLALMADATVTIGTVMEDAEGRSMSGWDFIEWSYDGSLLTERDQQDWVNTIALGGAGIEGVTEVGNDLGDTMELRTLDAGFEPELRLYEMVDSDINDIRELDRLEVEAGVIMLGLGDFDDGERWVIPPDGADLDIRIIEGPEDLVLSWDYEPLLRGFALGACVGEGIIAIDFAGGTLEVPVTFTSGSEGQAGCGS